MKKEIFIVIVCGLILGLLITFIVYRVRQDKLVDTNVDTGKRIELDSSLLTESENEDEQQIVKIKTPEAGAVLDEAKTTIECLVPPNTTAILFVNDVDQIKNVGADGIVNFEVELDGGSNLLELVSIDANGHAYSDRILVVYSNQSLEEILVSDKDLEEDENKNKESEQKNDE